MQYLRGVLERIRTLRLLQPFGKVFSAQSVAKQATLRDVAHVFK
jgi:hypothetical protein